MDTASAPPEPLDRSFPAEAPADRNDASTGDSRRLHPTAAHYDLVTTNESIRVRPADIGPAPALPRPVLHRLSSRPAPGSASWAPARSASVQRGENRVGVALEGILAPGASRPAAELARAPSTTAPPAVSRSVQTETGAAAPLGSSSYARPAAASGISGTQPLSGSHSRDMDELYENLLRRLRRELLLERERTGNVYGL
jgi:hypothetical protein